MPGPDAEPSPPASPSPPRGSPPQAIRRNGFAWLVLILLIAAAVVQIARDHQGISRHGIARATIGEFVHGILGFGLALGLYRLVPRAAIWIAIALAALATYGAATRLNLHGLTPAHIWTGIPFGLLFGLAAIDAIPRGVRESAMIDRATRWFAFLTLTLPLTAPLLFGGVAFLALATLTPLTLRTFVAAHALVIGAIALDAILAARGRP